MKKTKVKHVVHKKLQFTKKLSKFKTPKNTSRTAGTQVIDRRWETLDRFSPPQLNTKNGKGGVVNDRLFEYLFSGLWRYQLPANSDMMLRMGKLCAFDAG